MVDVHCKVTVLPERASAADDDSDAVGGGGGALDPPPPPHAGIVKKIADENTMPKKFFMFIVGS